MACQDQAQHPVFKGFLFFFAVLGLVFFSSSSFALQFNIDTMIQNLSKTIPSLMQLVTAVAYVMGMFLVIKGVMGLREYGEQRSHRSEGHGLKGPLITIFVGAALLYLPSSVQVGLSTFWSDPSPYAYVTETSDDSWGELLRSVFLILQLIGVIAFIRGLLIISSLGGQGGHQQGGFGKAITHIVGGILLINMYQFLQAVFNTLAIGQ